MIASTGATHVILGHSERREYFGETDELLAKKLKVVLAHGLIPIFCCGEKLEDREAGNHEALVGSQVQQALFGLDKDEMEKVIIAYEPVWAIGTGKTASAHQAEEMHAFIRSRVAEHYGQGLADSLSILYGGSVKPENAQELFDQPDVDGGLVGGASLKSRDFTNIIKAMG
jgi:triosephosphate isomerase